MKKLLVILLSFSILAFSTQTVCLASPVETEQSGCESTHCCKEEKSDEEKGSKPGKMKDDKSCCVSNVLTMEHTFGFTYNQVHALQLKTGFLEKFHTSQFAADFWQPPRA